MLSATSLTRLGAVYLISVGHWPAIQLLGEFQHNFYDAIA